MKPSSGGSGGAASYATITGVPNDNIPLRDALASKVNYKVFDNENIYTDLNNGNDLLGSGAIDNPFKTIEKSFLTSINGSLININKGYADLTGVVFPNNIGLIVRGASVPRDWISISGSGTYIEKAIFPLNLSSYQNILFKDAEFVLGSNNNTSFFENCHFYGDLKIKFNVHGAKITFSNCFFANRNSEILYTFSNASGGNNVVFLPSCTGDFHDFGQVFPKLFVTERLATDSNNGLMSKRDAEKVLYQTTIASVGDGLNFEFQFSSNLFVCNHGVSDYSCYCTGSDKSVILPNFENDPQASSYSHNRDSVKILNHNSSTNKLTVTTGTARLMIGINGSSVVSSEYTANESDVFCWDDTLKVWEIQ